jgi:putative transposase
LTFSCYRQYAFLERDRTREWLCEALAEARAKFGFQLWAYVIMPEHVHVLVILETPSTGCLPFSERSRSRSLGERSAYLARNAPQWLARVTVRGRPAAAAAFLAARRRL